MNTGLSIEVSTEGYDIDVVLEGTILVSELTFITDDELDAILADYVESTALATELLDYAEKAPSVSIIAAAGTYNIQQSDNNKVLEFSSSSAKTVVLLNTIAAFQCTIVNTGTGKLTIQAGSGVTIYSKDSDLSIEDQYGAATIYSSATNVFIAFGNLVP